MVMFTCNRCSKGLKKKDVLNHSFQCGGRDNINVACIDCLKDFRGNEYDNHTSCVSEEVRYGGKGVVAKETGKKQNQWLGIVRQVLAVNKSLDPPVRKFLQSVQHFENIPRQKKKFHNWANSAMHIKDTAFLDSVFGILQEEFQKNNHSNKEKDTPVTNGDESNSQNESGNVDESEGQIGNQESVAENGVKTSKKKKKNRVEEKPDECSEATEQNGESNLLGDKHEDQVLDDEIKGDTISKKKKKKRSRHEEDSVACMETLEANGDHSVEDQELLASEKSVEQNGVANKKKKKRNSVEDEPAETSEVTEMNDGHTVVDRSKLSKKERKMLKKKEKFEAELKEIENANQGDEVEEEPAAVETQKGKQKGKKRKLDEETNNEKLDVCGDSKKKKLVENIEENQNGEGSTTEQQAVSSPKKQKFNWHQMILDVLKNSKKDEVPVKKVTKKVINEYIALYGDKGIHDKLNAKMTKKLQTCPGIRLLKDKVKLLETNE